MEARTQERRAPPFDPNDWIDVTARALGVRTAPSPLVRKMVTDVLVAFASVYVPGKKPEEILGKEY